MKDIETLGNREAELLNELNEVRAEKAMAENLREIDPVKYIAQLVYADKRSGGTYGYEYGDFGDSEIRRATEIIDAANGDVGVAENFVRKFRIR